MKVVRCPRDNLWHIVYQAEHPDAHATTWCDAWRGWKLFTNGNVVDVMDVSPARAPTCLVCVARAAAVV